MFELIRSSFAYRRLLFSLARRDMASAHNGSVLGSLWVVIDPLIYVALTIVFFQFAIRGADTKGVPYVAWALPAILFWTFASSAINSSIGSVREYSYLLRHRTFDMRLVALIKLLSGFFVHLVLMAVLLLVIVLFLHVPLSWKTLGLAYYFVAMCALLLALCWVFSALGMFWKDIRNLVGVILQAGFWISPIFWEPDRFPLPVAMVMYLNPFYYPIHGYRTSILSADFGPHFWLISAYFWGLTLALLWLCSRLFNRLSKSFGDVA